MMWKNQGRTAWMATAAIATVNATVNIVNITSIESAIAQSSSPLQIAQSLVGQCRAAKRDIFIYQERNTNSRVRSVQQNEEVTLADEGGNGWIAISAPTTGFVQTPDLKFCAEASNTKPEPTPPTPTSKPTVLCRQVVITQGLIVRDQPSTEGKIVGSVAYRQQVTLNSDAETVVDKRVWVEIDAPVEGWVSSGIGGAANVGGCDRVDRAAKPAQPASTSQASTTSSTTSSTTYCSRVTWRGEGGLGVRREIGGSAFAALQYNQELTLDSREEKVMRDSQLEANRLWVEITEPMRGWVSSGIQGGGRNITPATPCR